MEPPCFCWFWVLLLFFVFCFEGFDDKGQLDEPEEDDADDYERYEVCIPAVVKVEYGQVICRGVS